MSNDACTVNVAGLDKLLKALKAKPPVARVGILGGDENRKETGNAPGNAEVGAVHEYGAPARGIPPRSFLRIPISDNLQKYMDTSGVLSKDKMDEVLKVGSVVPWLKEVAGIAERIVVEAFATSGFGKWAAWKDPNYTNNANMILVDTTQLRESITSEVKG